MNPKRGIVFKDLDGSITLLTLDPPRKRVFPTDDAAYSDLSPEKADIVELMDDDDALKMVSLRAICGVTLYEADNVCPAHLAINFALKSDTRALQRMIEEATPAVEDSGTISVSTDLV